MGRQPVAGIRLWPSTMGSLGRGFVMVAIGAAMLWPRYFFFSLFGPGVNLYTLMTLSLFLFAIYELLTKPAIQSLWFPAMRSSIFIVTITSIFYAWRLFCDLFGETPKDSLLTTIHEFLYVGTWLFSASVIFTDRKMRERVPILLGYLVLVCGFFGMLEVVTNRTILDLLGLTRFAVGDSATIDVLTGTKFRGGGYRAQSVFAHPIVYGQVMAAFAPLSLHFIFGTRQKRPVFAGLILVSVLFSVWVSNTRSPIFAGLTSVGLYGLMLVVKTRDLSLKSAMILIGAIVLACGAQYYSYELSTLAAGRNSEEASSSKSRSTMYEHGFAALRVKPFTGYGDGLSVEVAGLVGTGNVRTIDSFYLSNAVDSGYIGVLIAITMLLWIPLRGMALALADPDPESRSLTAMFAGLAASLAVGLTVATTSDTSTFIFMAAGYIIVKSGLQRRRPPPQNPRMAAGRADLDRGAIMA